MCWYPDISEVIELPALVLATCSTGASIDTSHHPISEVLHHIIVCYHKPQGQRGALQP